MIEVRDPEAMSLLFAHKLANEATVHTNLAVSDCSCSGAAEIVARPPNITGEISPCCGAMARRNGTCLICTSCGDTTACG